MISPQMIKELTEKTIKNLSEKGPEKARALKALVDQYGGITGLLQTVQTPEFRKKVETWIADGKKLVMTQDQVQKLLGNERVKALAERLQSTPEQVTQVLAEVLPPLLEKLEFATRRIPADSPVSRFLTGVKTFLSGSASGAASASSAPAESTSPSASSSNTDPA